ncbi:MAG: HDOD domain-containing protein [Planctomycetota bacterium]|nr:HDOD domain-containing protein [Planctomycetota bacterium]
MITEVSQNEEILKEIRALFGKAKLPTSPALAAQILELANDPNWTVAKFADLIQLDPILAARLLRLANSSDCTQRDEVTTIQRAVILLGVHRVRTLGLGFQLVSHLNKLGKCPFDIKTYWLHSVLRGCLARELAKEVAPSCSEDAFLVGLLQDCGILILVQLLGIEYANLLRTGDLSPAAFHEAEIERFRFNHVQTAVALAQEWQLPAAIVQPLAKHHTRTDLSSDSTDLDRLSAIGFAVASIELADGLSADPALAEYARTGLGLDEVALGNCIKRAGDTYGEVGQLLHGGLPEDLDVTSGKDRFVIRSLAGQDQSAGNSAAAAADAVVSAVDRIHLAESPVVPADLERIARELSERPSIRFVCQRKRQRKQLITPCSVASFTGMNLGLSIEEAYVYDISTRGIGLMVPSEKRRGEPIEIAIHTSKKNTLYVAGVVAFCRHVEGCIHQVGVQLFAHGRDPVLSSDPNSAVRNLDWVASALKSLNS